MLAVSGIGQRPFAVESLRRVADAFGRTVLPTVVALWPERRQRRTRSAKRGRQKSYLRLVPPPRGKRH